MEKLNMSKNDSLTSVRQCYLKIIRRFSHSVILFYQYYVRVIVRIFCQTWGYAELLFIQTCLLWLGLHFSHNVANAFVSTKFYNFLHVPFHCLVPARNYNCSLFVYRSVVFIKEHKGARSYTWFLSIFLIFHFVTPQPRGFFLRYTYEKKA